MSQEIGRQWIKSATAVLCVASVCISSIAMTSKISDTIKAKATGTSSEISASQGDETQGDANAEFVDEATTESVTDAQGNAEAITDASQEGTTASSSDGTAQGTTTKAPSGTASASGIPQTKADIITYCNTALNKVKSSKAGYSKHYVMKVKGSTSGIPSFLTALVTKDKTTTMAKGADSTDDFPAAGYSWSSHLRESDVATATCKQNGQYYDITLKLGKESNPAKGDASSYGRIMSVIDAKDAKEMSSLIKSVQMTYHDGYVTAKINKGTGNMVSCEISASADVNATISALGDITVTDIVSTETYTDFKW